MCKVNLQLCAIYSCTDDHARALNHCRVSAKTADLILMITQDHVQITLDNLAAEKARKEQLTLAIEP